MPGGVYGPISQAAAQFGIPVSLLGAPWQESMFNHGYSRAGALYGDVIWHVADRWNLTTGVRFAHDEKDFSWYNPTRTAAQLAGSANKSASASKSAHWCRFSGWRAIPEPSLR